MSDGKFTPGPWRVWSDANGVHQVGPSINLKVASMWHPPLGEAADNARLVAAAPDLVEALQEAEEYFDNRADADHDETGFVPNEEMKLLTVVRAAIAKATGQ